MDPQLLKELIESDKTLYATKQDGGGEFFRLQGIWYDKWKGLRIGWRKAEFWEDDIVAPSYFFKSNNYTVTERKDAFISQIMLDILTNG